MIVSVVVPFYDEEASIEAVLRRCVEAGAELRRARPEVGEVEVLAVDDGSRDGSAAAAARVPGVRLVRHASNRGYGAALKTGFAEARGSWLAFLDADGTCDPASLATLFDKARAEGLDVVVGARLHDASRMPLLRAFGNRLFRPLVRALGGDGAGDVASGIRVLSRRAYEAMLPLPDGMDFSPAMSARALLDPSLRLGEAPVPYDERVGASKLCPACDGARFLKVILDAGLVYRPHVFFAWAAGGLAASAALMLALPLGGPAAPLGHILRTGGPEPWMYFRFVLAAVCVSLAVFLTALGVLARALLGVVHRGRDGRLLGPGVAGRVARRFPLMGTAAFVLGVALNAGPLGSYWRTGQIPAEYWVWPIAGAVLTFSGLELWGFWVAARIADILWERAACGEGR